MSNRLNNPNKQNFTMIIWLAVSLLMFLIGGFAFVMSFRQLLEAAYAGGKDRLWEYWTFPLLLDGSILLFTLAALWFTLVGSRWRFVARMFVFLFTFLTAVLNYNHAALNFSSRSFLGIDWLNEAQFIAISAPLVYFTCVEFYVYMLHKKMTINAEFSTLRAIVEQVEELQKKVNALETKRDELQTEITNLETHQETVQQNLRDMSKQYLKALVWLGMTQAGMSQRNIAEMYGYKSAASINKGLALLNGQVEELIPRGVKND